MLYRYQIKFRGKTAVNARGKWAAPTLCEITMVPTKFGRWFGCQLRRGTARRSRDQDDGEWYWRWTTTDRYVGERIESMIEAAPIDTIEDMPIELLLEEGNGEASDDGRR